MLFNSVKMSTIKQLKFKSLGSVYVTHARSRRPDNNTINTQLAFLIWNHVELEVSRCRFGGGQ